MLLLPLSLVILLNLSLISSDAQANQIKTDTASEQDFEELGIHYGKYLKEVVAALDKDKKFTETIKNMDANDIKSGKVADQLRHVHEDIRKQLNDLKNMEINRLRDLAMRKNEVEQYGETYHGNDKRKWRTLGAQLSELPEHLASDRTHFDVNDLHKLMVAATNDLEKLDKERREDYKTYEMEKEWQFQERLKMMNETEKQEAIKARQKLKEKHDDHPKVHEPGTRSQFEEVWEKTDNLPKSEFDPKTFFALHDTNSDNYWDPGEVRKLLQIEISKLYDTNNPEDDPNEMNEEYERMREHVYKEIDADKDGLISRHEFLEYSQKSEFKNDNGWEDVSKKQAYTKQEYDEYLKDREKMIHNMHGHYDPSYYANQPSNMHLPNWGFGMPAGVNPAQYYGYQVDPNHPHAQQIAAQQHLAYQQAAAYQQPHAPYQQQAAVPQGYQQYYAQPAQQGQYQAPQGAYQAHPQAPLQHPQQGIAPAQIGQQPQQVSQAPQQMQPVQQPQQVQPPQQQLPPQQQQLPPQQQQLPPQQQQQQQQAQQPIQQQLPHQQQQQHNQQPMQQMQGQPVQNQQNVNQQPNQQYYQPPAQPGQQAPDQYHQKP